MILHVSKRRVKTLLNLVLVFVFAEGSGHHFLQASWGLE